MASQVIAPARATTPARARYAISGAARAPAAGGRGVIPPFRRCARRGGGGGGGGAPGGDGNQADGSPATNYWRASRMRAGGGGEGGRVIGLVLIGLVAGFLA